MVRFALLMMVAACAASGVPAHARAAESTVDIEMAARIYQAAAVREQVRASLGVMPAHIRQLFSSGNSSGLSEEQLAAVTKAAERGFRIDVFEAPALRALADNMDAATVDKAETFLSSDLGKRMVSDDVALAQLGEDNIDKVMSGEITTPSTPKRDVIIDKLERASRSTESTVDIFLSMGQAVAVGTAIGSGLDTTAVAERAHSSGENSRAGLEDNMRLPMRRFVAYGYRDLSDAELRRLLAFLISAPGKRYVSAYNASMGAGFDAMGKRTGEQLGESLRELAQAQAQPATPADRLAPSPPSTPPVLPHSPAAPSEPPPPTNPQ